MKNKIIKLLLTLMSLSILSGCINTNMNIVVTNYPLEFLVQRIAKDRVKIHRLDEGMLLQRSTISNDYESILKSGNVLFYISESQPYFELYDDVLKSSKIDMVDLSQYSKLYDFKRYLNVRISGEIQNFEGPYYDTPLLEKYDLYESDPILWIDPIAMTSMGRSILDYLNKKYPDQANYFNQNFEELEVELVRLYADFQKLRDVETPIAFVSLTPSFGNWQKSYFINVYPLVMSKYGVLPDEALMNVYRKRIETDNVQYIVYEENLPEEYIKLFNQVKTELDLIQINLHNLYTLSDKDIEKNEDYISLMNQNLEALFALGNEN